LSDEDYLDNERTRIPEGSAGDPGSLPVDDIPTYAGGKTPPDLNAAGLPEDVVKEQRGITLKRGYVIAGRFEILDRLGFGGMGAVYKVSDRAMGGEVKALKVMLPSLIHSDALRQRFVAEVQVSQKLTHRNIVRVHDIGHEGTFQFFTMEYIKGKTLHRYLSECGGILPIDQALYIADQICAALSEAHKSTIHRDLKPQNVMIQKNWTVKLLDFGLAKLMSPGGMTRSNMALGTAYYQAPEQTVGGKVDARADIYSLGVMLYEMVTGKVPTGRFKSACDVNPAVPQPVDKLIDQMLQAEPDDRPASVAEVRGILREAGFKRKSKKGLLIVGVLLALAVLGSLKLMGGGGPVEPETVFIKGGTFKMGSSSSESSLFAAKPVHDVTVGDFYIGKYEVTVDQFRTFVDATGYRTEAEKDAGASIRTGSSWVTKRNANWRNPYFSQTDIHPVVCVSWKDATAYCRWLSRATGKKYRLPTEAEWEFACRAGTRTARYWGDNDVKIYEYANGAHESVKRAGNPPGSAMQGDDGYDYTAPVGSYKPNPFGLYDMYGNVWEWCADWHDTTYYERSPKNNPQGPPSGQTHVLRSGGWYSDPESFCSAHRSTFKNAAANNIIGFRVAVDATDKGSSKDSAPVTASDAGGWVSLFNGRNLDGWTQLSGTARYTVENATIVGRTTAGSPISFLCSDKQYGDFELEFEVKCDAGLNSGVQIRSAQMTMKDLRQSARTSNLQVGSVFGPQIEIMSSPGNSGYIFGQSMLRGWLSPEPQGKNKSVNPHWHFKNDEWNKFRVIAVGPRIQTFINGAKITELNRLDVYKSHPKGFIGLQVYCVGAETGQYKVAWRNIRIRELI
jgi:formylglycine-generating enzyme required for sulfatase activity